MIVPGLGHELVQLYLLLPSSAIGSNVKLKVPEAEAATDAVRTFVELEYEPESPAPIPVHEKAVLPTLSPLHTLGELFVSQAEGVPEKVKGNRISEVAETEPALASEPDIIISFSL